MSTTAQGVVGSVLLAGYTIAGPLLTGILIGSAGLAPVARWFALVWILYVIGFALGPETRGRSLAELDAIGTDDGATT